MSLFKNIFGKKEEIKCAVCGQAVHDNFKTTYKKIRGCYGLYIIHFECDDKK